jgi:hypothetical protein
MRFHDAAVVVVDDILDDPLGFDFDVESRRPPWQWKLGLGAVVDDEHDLLNDNELMEEHSSQLRKSLADERTELVLLPGTNRNLKNKRLYNILLIRF